MKKNLLLMGIFKMAAGLFLMCVLLFLPAGSLHYYGAWRLLALLFIPMPVVGVVLYLKAPDLLRKRLNSREQEPEQKRVIILSSLIFIVGFVLSGLDFRFGWTRLPLPVILVGAILFLFAYGLYIEVMRENTYLSRTVEIQENQKVIDTGLYSIVRHPMYMAVLLSFAEIENICGLPIDHSFLQYKKELLAYSWQVEKISMKQQTVRFRKETGR